MKTRLVILSSLAVAVASWAEPTTRFAEEWFAPSPTSPKEFSIIDQATGVVRFGGMSSDGVVSFRPVVSTGITGVSDVASGIYAGVETLAIASPESNRVAVLLPSETFPVSRTLSGLNGIGPAALGEIDSGSGNELMLGSVFNGSSNGGLNEAVGDIASMPSVLASGATSILMRRIEPFLDDTTGDVAGIYSAVSGANTALGVVARSGGGNVQRITRITLAGEADLVTQVTTMSGDEVLIGYRRGSTAAHLIRISRPITVASSFTNSTVSLPYLVSSIVPVIHGGAGNIVDGVILIAANGTGGEWFRINAAANGLVPTGVKFTPTGATSVTGVLPLPGIGILALSGGATGGHSTGYSGYVWSGSSWELRDSGQLPSLPTGTANFATLLFYSDDPLVDESARLLGIQNSPDWTRRISSPDPVPGSVLRESYLSSIGGLSSATTQSVNAPSGTNFVVTNQVEPSLSIAAMGSPLSELYAPQLAVEPPSGSYEASLQVTATYDEDHYELLWRRIPSGSWMTWAGPIGVGYDFDLQFRLKNLTSGVSGPITSRSYQFPVSSLTDADSDGDGVPDYVEMGLSLDPFGGADSDGDGVSDLSEIIDGTDPGDPSSYSPNPTDIATASGMDLVAVARDTAALEIADGEEMAVRRLDGSLVAQGLVDAVSPALPDGGNRGVRLRSDSSLPQDEVLVLDSPFYFDLTNGERGGREILKIVDVKAPESFDAGYTPLGNDLSVDTAGWVTAAQTAAGSYERVTLRTILDPVDSAVSILMETLVREGLAAIRPIEDPVPAVEDFSLFPDRGPDAAKTFPSPVDVEFLRAGGFSFESALARSLVAESEMASLARGVYDRHVSAAASTPGMVLPVDALRVVLRGGAYPDGYEGATSAGNLSTARAAFDAAVADLSSVFRPVETWTIEVPEVSPGAAIYSRVADAAEVMLLSTTGDRFPLEQGLGLSAGTQFAVTGYTDTPAFNGRPTMAVTAVVLSLQPIATDRDLDGNILDDEWERFFFGATGQDPFSEPQPGYSLVQYFLDGLDPRGAEVPAGSAVSFLPVAVAFSSDGGGGFYLDFEFPESYRDQFDFIVEASETLAAGGFSTVSGVPFTALGGDRLRAVLPASAAMGPSTFYRVRVALR